MKTKFLPKDFKVPIIKATQRKRSIPKRIRLRDTKYIVISLKEEFDLLMRNRYSNVSEADRHRIWHIISSEMIELGSQIGSLDWHIKNHIIGS